MSPRLSLPAQSTHHPLARVHSARPCSTPPAQPRHALAPPRSPGSPGSLLLAPLALAYRRSLPCASDPFRLQPAQLREHSSLRIALAYRPLVACALRLACPSLPCLAEIAAPARQQVHLTIYGRPHMLASKAPELQVIKSQFHLTIASSVGMPANKAREREIVKWKSLLIKKNI